MLNRRSLITGLVSFVAAPAIVRAGSLMPVKKMILTEEEWFKSALRVAYSEVAEPDTFLVSRDIADMIYRIEPTMTPFVRYGGLLG